MDPAIAALAAHPQHLPTVARWIYEQWWTQVPGASIATLAARLRENLAQNALPLTLVASSAAGPVGTVTILEHDVGTERWPGLSPWLAALYVVPEVRRRGVGAALIDAALARAASFAAGSLYLLTSDQQAYYAARGWKVLDLREDAVVMVRSISAADQR